MVRDAGRTIAYSFGRFALWLMPLTVVFEWVGGVFTKSLLDRVLYLALFFGLFFCAELGPGRTLLAGAAARSGRRLLGAAMLALGAYTSWIALRWLLAGELGLPPFQPPPALAVEKYRLLSPLVAAWPLALGSSLLREERSGPRAYEQLGLWLALGFLLHFAARVHVQGLPVVPAHPATRPVLIACALALFGSIVVWRGSFRLRLALLLAAGFSLRALGLYTWEVDPAIRDMLALVMSAQERFVEGKNPYTIYAMQHGSELPLTYLPGLWLGYGAPRLLGLDLRWMAPLGELGAFGVLAWVARKIEGEQRAWAEAVVSCFAAVWLFSPSAQWNAIYAEPTLWWALLGITLALAWSGHLYAAALALGYAVATRHFAIVLAPFVLLYFVRMRGLRAALPLVASSGAVAALLLTPFVAAAPERFWFGTFRWLREYGPAHLEWFFDRFGFLALFHEKGALERLPHAQWGVVVACFVAAALSRRERIPAYAASAQLAFILLNVLLWDSFLLDGAMAAACVVVTRPLVQRAPAPVAPPSPRVLRLASVGVAIATLAGGYLGWTLLRSLRRSGDAAAHDYAVRAIRPEDYVIDRSDRRLAFIGGSWLLTRQEVAAPIGGSLYDGSWGGGPALHAKGRVWLITQLSRDRALRDWFAQLGRPLAQKTFGSLHVSLIEPHAMRLARLKAAQPGVALRRCQIGPGNWDMIAVELSADHPVSLTLAREKLGDALLLAGGFPNQDVVWPRRAVEITLRGATAQPQQLQVENLHGMQWRAVDTKAEKGKERELTIELRTRDPLVRTVCVELLPLEARGRSP